MAFSEQTEKLVNSLIQAEYKNACTQFGEKYHSLLEWCTYSENTKHAYENGLEKKCLGEKHHAHKLTKENVMFIREHYKPRDKQYSAVKLGERFGVTEYTIKDVIRGKSWGWL